MPAGVTGIARTREWDATISVELPELRESDLSEAELHAFADEVVSKPDLGSATSRVAEAMDAELPRPWTALVVRQGPTNWAAGGRRTRAELLRLVGVEATTVEVAVGPDGGRSAGVDGQPADTLVAPALDEAFRELERRGRARFQAFAARADNLDGERWLLSIDPL